MKILAYQKVFNLHTRNEVKPLIVVKSENVNATDLMICGLLNISLLAISFSKLPDNKIRFQGKLDGSIKFETEFIHLPTDTPLKSNAKGLEIESTQPS